MTKIFLTSAAAVTLAVAAWSAPATAADRDTGPQAKTATVQTAQDLSARRRHWRGRYHSYRHYPRYYYGGGYPYYGSYAYAPGPYYYGRPYRPFPFGFFPFY